MSDQDAAQQIGVDRGTIYRWRKSIAFQRELDRQRRQLWERSAGEIQSLVGPALSILRKQLASEDPILAMRAAGVLLRFATPSRLGAAAAGRPSKPPADESKQLADDLIDYIDAPLPGQPGCPEDMAAAAEEDDEDDEMIDDEEGDEAGEDDKS